MSTFYWLPSEYNVKSFNKHAALDLIRFSAGGLSRTELAEKMGLTRAAVSLIVNDLLKSGIIQETESRITPNGRPPVVLEINPSKGLVGAIDMGATHLSVAVADFSARILQEIEVPFDIKKGPEVCLAEANQLLRQILEDQGWKFSDLTAVGVGVPGPVITEAGMVVSPPIMPGWDHFPIRYRLEKMWGCPVTLNNDAELGALGEWAYGAGRGEKNIAYIKVGSGIGAGLILNRQIYGGTTGAAGEIGHLTVDENGPLCNCGNHGCLEAFAGGHAIAKQGQALAASGKRTLLSQIPIEKITAQDVAEAARRGDFHAQEIIRRAGTFIGIAIAGLINLFNPSIVIIGGGVAQVGDMLTNPIRQAVRERALRASEQSVRITTGMLGRRSLLIGATVQALNVAIHMMAENKNPNFRENTRTTPKATKKIHRARR
ncbi:MAG TPA: ROK family transcriptional regulator [Anaerolineales bacterium]|nr:ROK family transcriptional regulator [Anaerolineales bacterium]